MVRDIHGYGADAGTPRRRLQGAAVSLAAALAFLPALAVAGPFKAKTCADCHEDFVASVASRDAHQPFRDGDCEACHQRHGISPAVGLPVCPPGPLGRSLPHGVLLNTWMSWYEESVYGAGVLVRGDVSGGGTVAEGATGFVFVGSGLPLCWPW